MVIYQLNVKLYIKEDIKKIEVSDKLSKMIDFCMCKNEHYEKYHNAKDFKNYSFNSLYPIEPDGIYKSDNIYTIQIRTSSKDFVKFLEKNLPLNQYEYFVVLKSELKINNFKYIDKIYSLTPVVIKNTDGYWRNLENFSIDDYENRISVNLINKYNAITGEKISRKTKIFSTIEFMNKKPVVIKYKNIKLLGDKITLTICNDEVAQNIAVVALATGVGENNSRGLGYVNCKLL